MKIFYDYHKIRHSSLRDTIKLKLETFLSKLHCYALSASQPGPTVLFHLYNSHLIITAVYKNDDDDVIKRAF